MSWSSCQIWEQIASLSVRVHNEEKDMEKDLYDLCVYYEVNYKDLMLKLTQNYHESLETGQTITVMLTVAEQRVLHAVMEVIGEL